MTYWEDTEKIRGSYDFSNIDWQLNEAAKNNVDVLLVVGRKQPAGLCAARLRARVHGHERRRRSLVQVHRLLLRRR